MTQKKVVVLTGASSGMGYEAAKVFADHGWKVFAGARRYEKIPKGKSICALRLDVTDSLSIQNFVDQILKKSERIDLLINNAGYGEFGPAEDVPMEAIRRQFETNFFGAVELTQLILPTMRTRGTGKIINISSIVGNIYLPLGAYYNATKAALQQWSDVLDLEISPLGLRSICIQPGDTSSEWGNIAAENGLKNLKENSPYQLLAHRIANIKHRPGAKVASARELGQLFYQVAVQNRAPLRSYQSLNDRLLVRFVRVHPTLYKGIITRVCRSLVRHSS